jgi:starvation-inducible DNA-binding protein
MKPNIGIAEENLTAVAHQLNKILADELLLYIKTRKAHWNVEGPDFYSKHKFFEDQYEQLDEIMDDLAERIRSLGHYAVASLAEITKLTHLAEQSRETNDGNGFIKELLLDHESLITRLRSNIAPFAEEFKDLGTSDFITGLMEKHEKIAWMLRAHLR